MSSKPPAQRPTRLLFEPVNLLPASLVRPGHLIGKGEASGVSKPQKLGENRGVFFPPTRDLNFPHIFIRICRTLNHCFSQSWAWRSVSGAPIRTPKPRSQLPSPQPLPLPVSAGAASLPLTSPTAAHEAEVVEPGHLVLHDSRGIAQLSRVVLIVACHHSHYRSIWHVPQRYHLRAWGQGDSLER